jgi:predicted lipoprotein with Yx(FWY)xxD motif
VKKMSGVLVLSVAALIVAGCGGSGGGTTTTSTGGEGAQASGGGATTSESSAPPVKIAAKNVSGVGEVLVDGEGKTLYVFAPDKGKEVTCVSSCAAVWPPVKLEEGQKATGSGKVKSSLLGSDPSSEGGEVVTYAGWPLYGYVADTEPGKATGQGVNLNGGYWYVMSPAGKVIK